MIQQPQCLPELLPIDHGGPVDWPFEPFPRSALEGSIIDRFAAMARRHYARVAVSDLAREMTYAELAGLVDRIAAATIQAAAGREGPVAILLGPDVYFPAAMLGVLAAGRGFIPLDISNPIARNEIIAMESGAAAVISAGELAAGAARLFPANLPIVDIETVSAIVGFTPGPAPDSDDLAFIIYTSGSTGAPKGVCHSHRNLLHIVLHRTNFFHVDLEDRLALFYSPGVIGGVRAIFTALLNGASLHILPPRELQSAGLVCEIRARHITIISMVPTLFRRIAEAVPPHQLLETVRIFGLHGERVHWSDFDACRNLSSPKAFIYSGIGPTECGGQFCDWFIDDRVRATSLGIPVGRANPDVRVMIVGEDGRPAADGDSGEFVVASRYLALGYWRDPNLTARAFEVDPADPTIRIFKTGDWGRERPDGLYEFVGRKDQQIKLRGHRIEIGEIEVALRGFSGVKDTAVVLRLNETGLPRSLAAYVEPSRGVQGLLPRDLRAMLTKRLPRYMIPATLRVVDELPRLPNLKVDRVQLAEIDAAHLARMVNPINDPLIAEVIRVFESVLGTTGATPEDNVSSLGGDSLQAVNVALELEMRFRIAIPADIFESNQTIGELACWIAEVSRRIDARSLQVVPDKDIL